MVCVDGYTAGGVSCEEECARRCCVGSDACDGFTGEVCKDDTSCFGEEACRDANIGIVAHGCNGMRACDHVGYDDGGYVGSVSDSCNGKRACYWAASYGGKVDEITDDSCKGEKACYYVAGYYGHVSLINNSCKGDKACVYAACDEGSCGGIENSCNAASACNIGAEGDFDLPSGVTDRCNMPNECVFVSFEGRD